MSFALYQNTTPNQVLAQSSPIVTQIFCLYMFRGQYIWEGFLPDYDHTYWYTCWRFGWSVKACKMVYLTPNNQHILPYVSVYTLSHPGNDCYVSVYSTWKMLIIARSVTSLSLSGWEIKINKQKSNVLW